MGASCVDTVTNFILADLKTEAQPVYEALLRQGVIVRPMNAWGLSRFIRVTIGTKADNRRFADSLKKVLSLVLLFFLFFQAAVFADVIENKTGQLLEGKITSETADGITIDVDGMELTLKRGEIQSIRRGPVAKKINPLRKAPETKPENAAASASDPKAANVKPGIDISKLERPVIVFDERNWKIGYQDVRNSQVIAEFVVDGENVNHWTELVTAQLFIGLRSEPRYYVEYVKQKVLATCPSTQWQLLNQTPYDVMYAWSVKGCASAPDQSEIARVILGVDGMHVLHYAVKEAEMSAENRQKWIGCLQASQIVKPQAS